MNITQETFLTTTRSTVHSDYHLDPKDGKGNVLQVFLC